MEMEWKENRGGSSRSSGSSIRIRKIIVEYIAILRKKK